MGWCSYNGFILPELPAWDDITYPYAAILYYVHSDGSGYYALFVGSDRPFEYYASTESIVPENAKTVFCYTYTNGSLLDDTWSDVSETTGSWDDHSASMVVWTNINVRDNTGSLFMVASDPVPIENITGSNEYAYIHYTNGYTTAEDKVPALPEWDKVRYPHAIIAKYVYKELNVYSLLYSDSPFVQYELMDDDGDFLLGRQCCNAYGTTAHGCVYIDTFGRAIWSAAGLLSDQIRISYDYIVDTHTEIIWCTGIYNEAGELVKTPSTIIPEFPLKTWLTALVLGLAEPQRPISTAKPIYDNEWPVEWSFPGLLGNYNVPILSDGVPVHCLIKVSDLIPAAEEWEKLELDITENGVASTYRYLTQAAPLVVLQNDAGDSINLDIISEPTTIFGINYEQPGIYCQFVYGDTTEKEFSLRLLGEEAEPTAYSSEEEEVKANE